MKSQFSQNFGVGAFSLFSGEYLTRIWIFDILDYLPTLGIDIRKFFQFAGQDA